MKRNLAYFISLIPGIITVGGNLAGGNWVYANLIFTLGLLPIAEWFVTENKTNKAEEDSVLPDLVLVLHFFLQIFALGSLFYSFSQGKIVGFQIIGAAVSTGIHTGTSSIVVAHEMIHRKGAIWQFAGKFLLFTAGNIYFFIEHLKVHHKWVGTAKDPASAHRGESVYGFFVRSIVGQLSQSWKIEAERMREEGRSVFHLSNYVFRSSLFQLILWAILFYYFGTMGLLIFLHQIFVANFLLEYTNYIEHYGLSRSENERVREHHSWQTDKVISRILLIELSRHSDHHYFASKPYHTLISYEKSPVLPGGYASAFYLAIIPPIWFKIVDKTLDNYLKIYGQNTTLVK